MFYLVGDPAVASGPLSIRARAVDGTDLPHGWDFEQGQAVRIQDGLSVGSYRLVVDGLECTGQLPIRLRQETDFFLVLSDGGCEIAVIRVHPDDEDHGFARIQGRLIGAPPGTVVRLRSLDEPVNPVPSESRSDEGGFVMVVRSRLVDTWSRSQWDGKSWAARRSS
jgi:hypothetical protein